MFNFENEYQENLDKVYELDAENSKLDKDDLTVTLDNLIESFTVNQEFEILVKFQNRNESTNNFIDQVFGKSQSNASSFNDLLSSNFEGLVADDFQIEFFNKEHIIESSSENWESTNNTKSLSLKGAAKDIINFCIKFNRIIIKECNENSFAISIQSRNHASIITSFKNNDDLIMYKEISEEEVITRINSFLWGDFRSQINRGFITHDDHPDLESYLKSRAELLEVDDYSETIKDLPANSYIDVFYNLLREIWECNNPF